MYLVGKLADAGLVCLFVDDEPQVRALIVMRSRLRVERYGEAQHQRHDMHKESGGGGG